jgi:hypothetical protein
MKAMKQIVMLVLFALPGISVPNTFAQETPAENAPSTEDPAYFSCFNGTIRISAIIQFTDSVKVGFVDARDNRSYLLSPGQSAGDIEVVEANYESETVVLKLGEEFCTLSLSNDPNAPDAEVVEYDPKFYGGEAIENFLKEFPNAVDDGLVKFPLIPPKVAVGRGETIEKLLAENPDLRAIADMVVTGRGPGIEAMLAEHPELDIPTEIPGDSLGPGIEEALKNNPQIITNTIKFPAQDAAREP